MKFNRIIARLDIKGPNLVKGIHLEGLRVLGKPEDFAKYYYENGADELFYQDVVASLYERNSLHEIISSTAKKNFIPLTVGGGIRSIQDIREVLRAGADKVCINTAAIKSPQLIKEASLKFGSSTIVVAIEAIKQLDGKYFAFVDNGREETGREVFAWAKEVEELGAGEIVITSVDREGTGTGYDIELTKKIAMAVNIPVIAHGGPGKSEHISEVISDGHADAVAVASVIHYDFIAQQLSDMQNRTEGNISFLNSGRKQFGKIEPVSLRQIKQHLIQNHINTRP
ncbi:MAG: imidazole glycerol phosphate synthase subunit HisF [Chitinophagaceae bacterium]|jgi:cyclase|nr:imidazole glycerol phosphate synthase subunit HisF [Chitinophagaceae bacterium]OQY95707.1 MAG: imidazole glycerol phosphate synthase subunit HisF [Sphingobacteriales bacterium UTBCD1]